MLKKTTQAVLLSSLLLTGFAHAGLLNFDFSKLKTPTTQEFGFGTAVAGTVGTSYTLFRPTPVAEGENFAIRWGKKARKMKLRGLGFGASLALACAGTYANFNPVKTKNMLDPYLTQFNNLFTA